MLMRSLAMKNHAELTQTCFHSICTRLHFIAKGRCCLFHGRTGVGGGSWIGFVVSGVAIQRCSRGRGRRLARRGLTVVGERFLERVGLIHSVTADARMRSGAGAQPYFFLKMENMKEECEKRAFMLACWSSLRMEVKDFITDTRRHKPTSLNVKWSLPAQGHPSSPRTFAVVGSGLPLDGKSLPRPMFEWKTVPGPVLGQKHNLEQGGEC